MTDSTALDVDDPEFHLGSDDDRTTYRGTPYTGQAIEIGPDGTVVGRWSFVDGYDDGLSQAWHDNGALASEGLMQRGLAVGEWREWRRDGTLATLDVYARPGYLRLRKRWDEHGALIDNQLVAGAPGDVVELKPLGMYREMYDGERDELPSFTAALASEPPAEHARVLAYLRAAPRVFDIMSAVPDLLTDEGWIPGGASLCSDGEWIWRADFIEYYAGHPLTLPPEFLDHLRENGYRPTRFDQADQNFHAAVDRFR
ncbi:toxin-antitoxin system YwqK family antitoxin [Nocardia sp. NPDC060259]|uniref:toxin-antitoxin system YwqK family antitoxin n=1 Tax=Nocardia sp. NPDC060259 TaxID=3347088 RepID=UPI00366657DB